MKAILHSVLLAAAVALLHGSAGAQETKMVVPDVTVTAPGAQPTVPPYLRDPWKSTARNPMHGRWRNEETQFVERPCGSTRLSAGVAGRKCLVGYRLTTALGAQTGGSPCDMGLDVVMFRVGNLDIEADILSFDPYKVTALGPIPKWCRISAYSEYAEEDFQDMNQVTRRGSNFRNLQTGGADPERSIEFSDSSRQCIAMRRLGPAWNGGNVWVMHVSICRGDGAVISAQDVAYTSSALQIRLYDPNGNLVVPPK